MSGESSYPAVTRQRPTMRDVAALAGVSLKTVSRVVNGISTVDPALSSKVSAAAAKLGYRPNLTASSLRRGDRRTGMVGMLVEDTANPFSAALMRSVENVAHERGVLVLIGSLDEDPARERTLTRALIDRRVDGLVIVPAGADQSYLIRERDAGTRLVFVDRQPAQLSADAVVSDNRDGAVTAVRHLLAHGHRRIAYLGDRTSIFTAARRFAGYRHALEVAHVPLDDGLIHQELSTDLAATGAARAVLDQPDPPTAIFASQNLITIAATRVLRERGAQNSVALIGFDDFPLADLLEPGVSVIAQDIERLGHLAAEILFRRLDGDASPPRTHTVPTRLIARGSGEIRHPEVRRG